MSFAQELAEAQRAPRTQAAKAEATEVSGGPGDVTIEPLELPVGGREEIKPEPPPAKIKINGKEFNSVDEAVSFAETMLAKTEGMTEAIEKLTKKAEPVEEKPVVRTLEQEIEEELFVNPASALEKYKKAIMEQVLESVMGLEKEKVQAAESQKQLESYWNSFYSENKDLENFKEEVSYIENKYWDEIKDLPLKKASEFLSTKTRELINLNAQKYAKAREALLPKKELPAGPARVAPSGQGFVSASMGSTSEEVVDFIKQLNQHRKRK